MFGQKLKEFVYDYAYKSAWWAHANEYTVYCGYRYFTYTLTCLEFDPRILFQSELLVLTINGKAELVVQDAKSYQRLLDLAERLETIQAVKESLASVERGEGRPLDTVFDELERELRTKVQT
jgi:hypothetical protein